MPKEGERKAEKLPRLKDRGYILAFIYGVLFLVMLGNICYTTIWDEPDWVFDVGTVLIIGTPLSGIPLIITGLQIHRIDRRWLAEMDGLAFTWCIAVSHLVGLGVLVLWIYGGL